MTHNRFSQLSYKLEVSLGCLKVASQKNVYISSTKMTDKENSNKKTKKSAQAQNARNIDSQFTIWNLASSMILLHNIIGWYR